MLIIGLTGSLATGKSSVSALLSKPPYCLPIIDADLIAREVVEPGTYGYEQIVRTFSPLHPDLVKAGSLAGDEAAVLDRVVLGRIVFGGTPAHESARKKLNGIVHPLVRASMLRRILWYYSRGYWAVVLDVPLLFESGMDLLWGVVVVVTLASAEVQLDRLCARNAELTRQQAAERVQSQMGLQEKVERVRARGAVRGVVLSNDGTREQLEVEVQKLVSQIGKLGGQQGWKRWWAWQSPLGALGWAVWEGWRGWRARQDFEAARTRKCL